MEYLWCTTIASKQAARKKVQYIDEKESHETKGTTRQASEPERGISEVLARCLDSLGIIPFRCLLLRQVLRMMIIIWAFIIRATSHTRSQEP
jgi:hypothetical protein